jgi:hypothetical protein
MLVSQVEGLRHYLQWTQAKRSRIQMILLALVEALLQDFRQNEGMTLKLHQWWMAFASPESLYLVEGMRLVVLWLGRVGVRLDETACNVLLRGRVFRARVGLSQHRSRTNYSGNSDQRVRGKSVFWRDFGGFQLKDQLNSSCRGEDADTGRCHPRQWLKVLN